MISVSRRDVCAGLCAGALASWGAGPAVAAEQEGLGAIAQKAGVQFGASIGMEALKNPDYGRLYVAQTKIVTTDLALKFDYLRPRPDVFDFGPADALIDFAQKNGLAVRGHTLAWNENLPDWVKTLSAAEAERVFDEHIDKVVSRYAGRIQSWDVVNEPFWPDHEQPFGFRNGPWLAAMGPSYIRRAFERTRAIDKTARLVLNEAFCDQDTDLGHAVRGRLLALVDAMLDQGLPLQAVGLQSHLQPQLPYNDDAFQDFVAEIATRRIDIYITEMDVNDQSFADDISLRDAQVAQRYAEFLKRVMTIPSVKMLVTWQLADRYSGYRKAALAKDPHAARLPRPVLFDENLASKPAFEAVAQVFQRSDVTLAATRRESVNSW
jgi:endo-1,4-beta-xylanase